MRRVSIGDYWLLTQLDFLLMRKKGLLCFSLCLYLALSTAAVLLRWLFLISMTGKKLCEWWKNVDYIIRKDFFSPDMYRNGKAIHLHNTHCMSATNFSMNQNCSVVLLILKENCKVRYEQTNWHDLSTYFQEIDELFWKFGEKLRNEGSTPSLLRAPFTALSALNRNPTFFQDSTSRLIHFPTCQLKTISKQYGLWTQTHVLLCCYDWQ